MSRTVVHAIFDNRGKAYVKWESLMSGLTGACANAGMALQVHSPDDIPKLAESCKDPVVLSGTDEKFLREAINRLREAHLRIVLAGNDGEQFDSGISCSSPSRKEEARQMINYLYGCGRRRIALVGFGYRSLNDRMRLQAACETMRVFEINHDIADEYSWLKDPKTCIDAFVPNALNYDAVLTPNDVIAVSLVNALETNGIKVPDQLYVAGFGNMMIGRFHIPGITSTDMDMNMVGKQTFTVWQCLRKDISGNLVCRVTVPCRIHVRESTGCRPVLSKAAPDLPIFEDHYYDNEMIAPLEAMERCLISLDRTDAEILSDYCEGYNNSEICDRRFISEGSLRYRRNRIFEKLGVAGRRQLLEMVRLVFGNHNPFEKLSLAAPSRTRKKK